ncbi:DUF2680 domain-containing protein [Sporomusa malonica]|uniref:Zinc resistance-associated protein n=1 Tax=Sporomusa malonica TaxID=112901 RepID=A0A1W2ELC1_9FIRM|nr:DUF2680 domain-containing protein [Sporomusa malonica]SMD09928.1 Protein of unknown function [Sporomusa malonica]
MKKITIFALIGILVLSLAGAVALAAPGGNPGMFCPPFGPAGQQANLTDEQKAQIATWQKEMLEHKKQVLQKEVEWGWITQAQADEHIAFMEQQQKDGKPGMGMGHRRGHGMGPGQGMGPMQGCYGNANVPVQQ